MQCLFCGKELALLKRWRGGGEFCSEAHRKEYQDQYEQLALARLMQANPPTEPTAPLHALDPRLESPRVEQAPAPAPAAVIETPVYVAPAYVAEELAGQPAEETSPAPLAGFLSEPLMPAVTPFEQAGLIELDHTWERVASLPTFSVMADSTDSEGSESSGSQGCLPPAARVELALSLRALEYRTRTNERGMELREFTATAPIMELQPRPETGNEPDGADDVMEILMSPHPPQKAKPWLGLPRGFPAAPAELGDLARLDFATTGFAYSDGPVTAPQAAAIVPINAPDIPPAPPAAFTAPAEPVATEPPPPEIVTKALPVTLHGLAATRRKLVQAYPSAIAAASDVQIPPSAALPLRPTIVFGPAPVRAAEAAASPVQPGPVQSTPAQSKSEERPRSSVVPAPKPVPMKRQAAAETPVAGPRVTPRAESRQASPAPKSWESTTASDAAIPSLRLEATESAWSKLSTSVKIGVAAALVVALSGVAYLVTRGNGKTISTAPVAATSTPEVATGVAISGGWIDDWADAAKTKRHISVLSGSLKLSDYRLEFQAQIQTKAIGWIFRGLNPRNYYVTKLEIVTPCLLYTSDA